MTYFSRRNEYLVEYSGHEEISTSFRKRISTIIEKYVIDYVGGYGQDSRSFIKSSKFSYEVNKEFPGRYLESLIATGLFHELFSLIEILLDLSNSHLDYDIKRELFSEIQQAFKLSGSVYKINDKNRIELKIDKDAAEKIDSIKQILAPYPELSHRFFQAVGNLVGRRAKPEDVVKDIFVASEGYLKLITQTSRFGEAVKELFKKNHINKEQKKVLDALHEFRSDAYGAGHAGNSVTPDEESALWFLDTIIAQMRMIEKKVSK